MVNCTRIQTRCQIWSLLITQTTLQLLTSSLSLWCCLTCSWSWGIWKFSQLFTPVQCYSCKHSLVILFEFPLAAETLMWNIAPCTPQNSKSFMGPPVTQEPGEQHGRNHQQESPKWRNEIRFPWRGGLLECDEKKPHPSSPVRTHTLEAFAKPRERK